MIKPLEEVKRNRVESIYRGFEVLRENLPGHGEQGMFNSKYLI